MTKPPPPPPPKRQAHIKKRSGVCPACREDIHTVGHSYCPHCGTPLTSDFTERRDPTKRISNKAIQPQTKSASRLFVLLLIILVTVGGIWFFGISNNHIFSSKFDSMLEKAEETLADENLDNFIELAGGSNFYNYMHNHLRVTGNQNYFIEKLVALTADEGRTLTSSEVNADFELLMRTVEETAGSGNEAHTVIKSRLNTGIIESIKIADDDVKCLYAAAVDMSIDFSDIDLLENSMQELEQRSGMPYGRVADAITRLEEYRKTEQIEILNTIGAIASDYR